jgi:hypothetical protein
MRIKAKGIPMTETILAKVSPSGPRRFAAVGTMGLLGTLVVYMGMGADVAGFSERLVLIVTGAIALVMAMRLYNQTRIVIELTETELRDTSGRVLAEVSKIVRVERGAFAFKPSNGFLVVTSEKMPRKFVPGMWWRFGTRLGVGGVCAANETKAMAEVLSMVITQRAIDAANDD